MSQPSAATEQTQTGATPHWWSPWRELLAARYDLARWEVKSDVDSTRRLAAVAGAGAVLALTGLPLLLIVLSQTLAAATETDAIGWELLFGGIFTIVGAGLIWTGWRTFRRDFAGLRQTLAELREDQIWLEELAAETARTAGLDVGDDDEKRASRERA